MNYAYAGLGTFKSGAWGNISGTGNDTYLRILLETISELIDSYCHPGQRFQPETATKYFSSDPTDRYTLWIPYLLSVTSIKSDNDRDNTYEVTWTDPSGSTPGNYTLWPWNTFPKRRIETDSRSSTAKEFLGFQRDTEVAGVWGYGDGVSATPYADSGADVATGDWAAAATSVDVASGHGSLLEAGETVLVDTEQIYITAISTDTLTVVRGVNGTTAATHTAGKALNVYAYPSQVSAAVLIQASRLWRRKDSMFATMAGLNETGQMQIETGLDPDVMVLLSRFKKLVFV